MMDYNVVSWITMPSWLSLSNHPLYSLTITSPSCLEGLFPSALVKKAQCSQCHYVFRVKDSPLLFMELSIISVTSTVMSFWAFFHPARIYYGPILRGWESGYKVGRSLVDRAQQPGRWVSEQACAAQLLRFSKLSLLISTKKRWWQSLLALTLCASKSRQRRKVTWQNPTSPRRRPLVAASI